MTTKAEQHAKDEQAAEQHRMDGIAAEQDRQTHLVDPLTHPSSGDPPPAISPAGDRLGTVPVTRNAVADTEQAKQEGLDAAEKNQPTKAEKAKAKPAEKKAEAKTQQPSKDAPEAKAPAPQPDRPSWMPSFGPAKEPNDKK